MVVCNDVAIAGQDHAAAGALADGLAHVHIISRAFGGDLYHRVGGLCSDLAHGQIPVRGRPGRNRQR